MCFDFPPNQGIGGRRWAKLARAMADKGVKVFVIKADAIVGNVPSPWKKDTEHPNISVTSIARNYPLAISHPRKGLKGKFAFRLHTSLLKLKTKGTIYDISVGWEKSFHKAANEIVSRENIHHVIVTGAPFHLLTETARLKDKFNHLKVLCDYRDPWITGVNYGMPQLSPARMQHEKDLQHEVFLKVDIVTAVNSFMLEEIRQSDERNKEAKCRFEVIPHFFDRKDVAAISKQARFDEGGIHLVYGGALYMGLEPFFEKINFWLTRIQTEHPDFYRKLRFDIYTPDVRYRDLVINHSNVLNIQKPIGGELFNELAKADFAVIFSAHHNKDYLTTKFMEYLPLRKPLVHIGEEGFCRDFILKNNLGITWETFEDAFTRSKLADMRFNDTYHSEDHEVVKVTEVLIALLESA